MWNQSDQGPVKQLLSTTEQESKMRSLQLVAATLTLLMSLGMISGCANTGFKSTPEQTQVVSDLVTERVITRAFFDEPRLSGTHIIVGCVDGIVTLGGNVNDGSQRAIAEKIANDVEGVQEVINNITT